MPYKDKEKQKIAQHKHYVDNRKAYNTRRTKQRHETKAWFQELTKNDICKFCRRR